MASVDQVTDNNIIRIETGNITGKATYVDGPFIIDPHGLLLIRGALAFRGLDAPSYDKSLVAFSAAASPFAKLIASIM